MQLLVVNMHETDEIPMFYHRCAQYIISSVAIIVNIKIPFASLSEPRAAGDLYSRGRTQDSSLRKDHTDMPNNRG